MTRTYDDAITALNTLQTNFKVLDAIRKSGGKMNEQALPEMIDWARRIGYKPSDFDKLNIIHVSGTKGKGSTCAFVGSILRQYQCPEYIARRTSAPSPIHARATSPPASPTHFDPNNTDNKLNLHLHPIGKIGMYTSPHLRAVRERIVLNAEPISPYVFADYFFQVWDRLEASAKVEGKDPKEKPVYFRYLTLMAFHVFLSEGVHTAIFEVGVGGEYDSTNIIEKPSVCGVTTLGIDHTAVLGETIEEIAWHKAGIFKAGVPAYSVNQLPTARKVLEDRARERGTSLSFVSPKVCVAVEKAHLGLAAEFQKQNAGLAVHLAAAHLKRMGAPVIPDISREEEEGLPREFLRGLEEVQWSGRCEVLSDDSPNGAIEWNVDGAHTHESIKMAARWYAERVSSIEEEAAKATGNKVVGGLRHFFTGSRRKSTDLEKDSSEHPLRILLFNQQTRDAPALLKSLHSSLRNSPLIPIGSKATKVFDHAIFTTNTAFRPKSDLEHGNRKDLHNAYLSQEEIAALSVQGACCKAWNELDPSCQTHIFRSIEEAEHFIRKLAKHGEVKEGDASHGHHAHRRKSSEDSTRKETYKAIPLPKPFEEDGLTSGEKLQNLKLESETAGPKTEKTKLIPGSIKIEALVTGSLHLVGGFLEVRDNVLLHKKRHLLKKEKENRLRSDMYNEGTGQRRSADLTSKHRRHGSTVSVTEEPEEEEAVSVKT